MVFLLLCWYIFGDGEINSFSRWAQSCQTIGLLQNNVIILSVFKLGRFWSTYNVMELNLEENLYFLSRSMQYDQI